MRTLISNPTIVNNGEQFAGSIVVNDGKIVEILRDNELPRAECDEIIEATGLSVENVRTILYRTRQMLRELYNKLNG